jgi:hypothetical protein
MPNVCGRGREYFCSSTELPGLETRRVPFELRDSPACPPEDWPFPPMIEGAADRGYLDSASEEFTHGAPARETRFTPSAYLRTQYARRTCGWNYRAYRTPNF